MLALPPQLRWTTDICAQSTRFCCLKPACQLNQGLQKQRAGHDRVIRKVKRKEILIPLAPEESRIPKTFLDSDMITIKQVPEEVIVPQSHPTKTVEIKKQMNYSQIAKKYGTSVKILNHLNGLDLPHDEEIAVGSQLYVPGGAK